MILILDALILYQHVIHVGLVSGSVYSSNFSMMSLSRAYCGGFLNKFSIFDSAQYQHNVRLCMCACAFVCVRVRVSVCVVCVWSQKQAKVSCNTFSQDMDETTNSI